MRAAPLLTLLVVVMIGCGGNTDADASTDGSSADAGLDASIRDGGADGGGTDGGGSDGGIDAGQPDAGLDASALDAEVDGGDLDAGVADAALDAGPPTFDPDAATTLPLPPSSTDFGASIAVSPDGSTLAIGDPQAGAGSTGAVYVYTREPTGWTQIQTLPGGPERTDFGAGLAFMPGTLTLAVGDYSTSSTRSGTVDLYAFAGPGYETTPYQTIAAATGSNFGIAVAFSPDGGTLAVGDPLGGSRGLVYVYSRDTGMRFESAPDQTFGPPVGTLGRFGASIAFSPDGALLLVGDDLRIDTGGVVYELPFAAGVVTTTPVDTIAAPAGTSEQFGAAIALSPDGRVLAVGTPYSGPGGPRGSVSLYSFPGSSTPYATLARTDGESFGRGLAFTADGATLVVGDRNADAASRAGAVYLLPAR